MLHALSISKRGVMLLDIDRINFSRNYFLIDVLNPTNDELEKISKKAKLDLNDLKCSLDRKEKPRVEKRDKYNLIIFRTISGTSILPLGIIISKKFIITIHKDEITSLKKLIEEETPKDVNKIVYDILSGIIKEFSTALESMEDKLDHMETKAIKAESNMEEMFSLKKNLIYLRKVIVSNREVIELIIKGVVPILRDKTLFNVLYVELSQLVDTEELIKDRLTGILEVHLSSISNRLNEVMKSFTVIASLFLLPVLISGIYGMNFKIIPLAEHQYGFWFAVAFMFIAMFLMILFFKIRRWI